MAPSKTKTPTAQAEEEKEMDGLTAEQNKKVLASFASLLGYLIFMPFFLSYIYLFVFGPIIYLYMFQHCPSEKSFDAKRELKRVLRGDNLPADHPDKPKGFLAGAISRVAATVSTEIATGLGYEVTMWNFGKAAILVWVRVPAAKMDFYWIGAFSHWTYLYSSEIPEEGLKRD